MDYSRHIKGTANTREQVHDLPDWLMIPAGIVGAVMFWAFLVAF